MKLGLLALASRRDDEAVSRFERAAYLDSDGTMTDAIAFRAAGPRAQLIRLYSKTGRDLTAIRLGPGDIPTSNSRGWRSLMRMALPDGLASSDGVAFEPPLHGKSRNPG